jgi:NADPH-dependent 2,4-dienoyl-CoA reductase/sulfur reductase-like enzyme
MLNRRRFLIGAAGFGTAVSLLTRPALAQAQPKVVVIGGGPAGASVVHRLAGEAKGKLDITLVEPQKVYTTCFYSNLYLGGFQPLEVLQHTYEATAALPGVTIAQDRAKSIDRDRRQVTLAGGQTLAYDRLVLSPGIDVDYNSVPGWSKDAEERMPHAWKAGPQTELLRRQLLTVPDGGLVIMIAPPDPYRCPPGPYERISMMAHVLKSSGKANVRIVILDPKEKFSKQPLFQQGWEKHYPGMIEWLSPMIHGGIKRVDPATMTVETDFETYRQAALINVIPRQTAGRIAIDAALTDVSGYCEIDPFTMKAKTDAHIFVLGDACVAGDMPKSAFSANSQAQVVAQRIGEELLGTKAPEAIFRNRCWSLIAENDSVFVGGTYRPTPQKIAQTESVISKLDDTADIRRVNYEDSAGWYAGLTAEMFG